MDKAGGGSSLLYYGADGRWSAPVVGTPAGDLPVGTPGNDTLVKFLTLFGEPIVWRVIGKDLPGMPEHSVTLFSDKIIALRCFDAKEPSNPNNTQRLEGNSDWSVSNLRQWMNSDAAAGEWYSPQHQHDAPPSADNVWKDSNAAVNPYESETGMLYESTQLERDLTLTTDHIYGNGNACKDKFFPLTTNELGLETIANNGTKIAYFADNSSGITQCTTQCITHSNYRSNPATIDTWTYWTATRYPSSTGAVQFLTSAGGLYYGIACHGAIGVRPACNIPQTALFAPNPDGVYTLTL